MRQNSIGLIIVITIVLIIMLAALIAGQRRMGTDNQYAEADLGDLQMQDQIQTEKRENLGLPEKVTSVTFTENKEYLAKVNTSAGSFTVKLLTTENPLTAANFYALAKEGFYNNTVFHRTVKDFVIQGGDPTGTGTGGPGYSFDDENMTRDYTRGIVAMANSGPNTNGSQFFVVLDTLDQLPKLYTVFGEVVEGMETVDAIATAETVLNDFGENSKPVNPVSITSIELIEE